MSPENVRTILDALKFQEWKYTCQIEREPKTRGGKPNLTRAALQKELDKIAAARIAFRNAPYVWHSNEEGV